MSRSYGTLRIKNLPDPNDRHVLAAAIKAKANYIVTFNLKDFPKTVLTQYKIEAKHPDDFVALLIKINQQAVLGAVNRLRTSLRNPTKTTTQYLNTLEKQALTKSVSILKEHAELI